MKIPQLFIRVGNGFSPIGDPVYNRPIYFWDDSLQRIVPDEGQLHLKVIEGSPYLVFECRRRCFSLDHINSHPSGNLMK